MSFIVYGLPRSRTFWLSRFLSYGDWDCGHDEIRHARSLEDIETWFKRPNIGTVETAAAPFWRLVPDHVSVVVVRRPVADVVNSLARLMPVNENAANIIEQLDRKLDQIEHRVPCLSVKFEDLETESTCARVFEYCLPYQHDHAWWGQMDGLNLQVNMANLVRYYQAYEPQLRKLAKIAKQKTLANMARPVREVDGITIQQESFESFYRDGRKLFEEHLVQVGEAPDAWSEKNIPLMDAIDQLGFMQITTARSNGRMFGYLMAVISPSLESANVMSAMHLTFYASKDTRGLGHKLQRASIEGLRARGIDELFLRAGTRGDGPRMGSLYERMGAVDAGHLYMLGL